MTDKEKVKKIDKKTLPEEDQIIKQENTDKIVLKTPAEAQFEVTITDESVTQNGTIESASMTPFFTNFGIHINLNQDSQDEDIKDFLDEILGNQDNDNQNIDKTPDINFDKTYHSLDYIDRNDIKGIDLTDLKNFYAANGNSSEKTYEYLKNYIKENKDNPEQIYSTISRLLDNFETLYDDNKPHKKVGENQSDILNKIINTPESGELSGFICGPIHSFIMKTLHDCGIEAAMLGGTTPDGGNHLTLLYRIEDGKYAFNDYGSNIVINASNIKDAAKEVYKRSSEIESGGYITLQNDGEKAYTEFALKKEAVFGDEMDKRDYHLESPFDIKINQEPSIKGTVNISTNGNISAKAGGSLVYGNNAKTKETSLTLGYKQNNETDIFLKSKSAGLKAEHKGINENNGKFFDTKAIVSYTEGKIGGCEFSRDTTASLNAEIRMNNDIRKDLTEAGLSQEEINRYAPAVNPNIYDNVSKRYKSAPDAQYLSTFFKGAAGKENTLVDTGNMQLSNTSKASLYCGMTFSLNNSGFHGDARILAENGFELKNNFKNAVLKNNLSGGVFAELKQTTEGLCISAQPGVKLNAASSVSYSPNENLQLNAGVKAGSAITPVDKDFGLQGGVSAAFKPADSNVILYTDAGAGLYRQKITIGGFNEQTENKTNFSIGLGAQLNPKTSVSLRYNREHDALNKTRSNSSVTIGTRITF